ncbi:MAG TPA: hypothetical protein VLM20_04660 [Methylophilaceae bacterium]|nr:hypothetical protein [Methylophilaceae bacterium]
MKVTSKFTLLLCIGLLLINFAHADLEDLNSFHQHGDTEKSMVWSLQPNESLAQLAVKFYPNNPDMQQKFIAKTLQLNKDNTHISGAETKLSNIEAIKIPYLESLSAAGGKLKRSSENVDDQPLQLSYNIKSTIEKVKDILKHIPSQLIHEYEALLQRNAFLKEELEKLNKKIVFLESKLGELRLALDRTLTLTASPKPLKNLDVANKTLLKTQSAATKVPEDQSAEVTQEAQSFFDFNNYLLWLALIVFALLLMVISFFYKKYQEKKYNQLVNSISQQNQIRTFSIGEADEGYQEGILTSITLNNDTQLEEHNTESILREAKMLMAQGSLEDAIENLKWAIRAKSKVGINVWLYLLELLRQQNSKRDFEKFAFELHQNFNVMKPLWEQGTVPIVDAQSLEDLPYIVKFLTTKWPNEKIIPYLEKLIQDNHGGERSGFSQAVIEEILLLINVLKARQYL